MPRDSISSNNHRDRNRAAIVSHVLMHCCASTATINCNPASATASAATTTPTGSRWFQLRNTQYRIEMHGPNRGIAFPIRIIIPPAATIRWTADCWRWSVSLILSSASFRLWPRSRRFARPQARLKSRTSTLSTAM